MGNADELRKCVPVENEIGTRDARQGYNNYAKTGRSFGLSGGTDSAIPNPVSIDSNNSTGSVNSNVDTTSTITASTTTTEITSMSDDWKLEVDKLKREIRSLKQPPSFACHKVTKNKQDSIITYENCKVHTDGM